MKKGIAISLWGTAVEAVGFALDIAHHLNIGIQTPEGLLSPYHFIIIAGFFINAAGVLMTLVSSRK